MQIIAHALEGAEITLQPAAAHRSALTNAAALADDRAAQAAGSYGWDLLCPYTFEAVWNGGPRPEDITINAPGFALSILGDGILSLALGYTFTVESGHQLWVRGPANQPKDGIAPIERLVEAELLPLVTAIHWRFTHPNQTVRFGVGEPFCTIVPYPAGYIETVRGVIHTAGAAVPAPVLPAAAPQVDAGLPGVSCICCTYGRPALLEEAIESFLRQDYAGPKELIIINDLADQTLIYEHPQVRIINLAQRMHSVGEKTNTAVALAAYDLICPWDDDDIYLPHRLRLAVNSLDPKRGFFKAAQAFFWNNGAISSVERNLFHAGACFTRALFDKAGGYPHQNSGYDMVLEQAFDQLAFAATTPAELPAEQLYYVYRWAGTESYHISALQQQHDDARSYAEAAAFVARQVAAGAIPTGAIRLQPQWRHDYAALAQAFVAQYDPTTTTTVAPAAAEADPPAPPPIVFTHMPALLAPEQAAGLFHGHAPRALSVIIPAANESFYLQRTVEQFQATLPPNSEIIVVDNGSTDGCADFLNAAPAIAPPDASVAVRLLRTSESLGVSRARNLGLAHAYGEVAVVADAHVDLPEGWWQPMVATLNRPGVGLVGPGFTVLGNNAYPPACGQRIAEPNLRTEWLPFKGREAYPVPALGGGFMAFRRETLHHVGMFDEGMVQWGAEDLEICLRMWLMGYEVWVTPEVAIPHYFRQKNPNKVEYYWVVHNTLRTAILHFGEERLTRVLWAFGNNKLYPKAMALCAASDVWARRAALQQTRRYNDDWFFAHPYFAQIDMDV